MSTETKDTTVLVTGGSGYVGSWAISALLRQGYRVRTTVRHLKREGEVRAAVAREAGSATERLSFFVADLLRDEGWERAAEGAEYILHVASPLATGEFKGQDLVRPAREGTLRVMKAGARAGVKRVVMTSSLLAALPPAGHDDSRPIDESVWTDLSGKDINNYTRSKTLAEQDAWDFIRQEGGSMTLSTVLPAIIQGPVLGKDFSGSVAMVAQLLGGKMPALPRFGSSIVDVRDLVDLHLKAMTAPEAAGQRFAAASDFLWMTDIARALREHLGARATKVPTRVLPDAVVRLLALVHSDLRLLVPNLGLRQEFSSAKAQRLLGWHPRPATRSILDGAESLLREGLV